MAWGHPWQELSCTEGKNKINENENQLAVNQTVQIWKWMQPCMAINNNNKGR